MAEAARAHALEMFTQSSARYDEGDLEAAVALLQQAYAVFPEPVLLYNLGRAEEGLGNDDAAISAYDGYLAAEPEAKDRGAISRRLQTLRERVAEREHDADRGEGPCPTPSSRPVTPATPSQRHDGPSTLLQAAPWLVAGLGAATIAGSGVLWLLAADRHELAQADHDVVSAQEAQRRAVDLARAATFLLVGGSVLTAAGATWGVVTLMPSRSKTNATTRVGLAVGLDAVLLSGQF